jgi:hypothetical protein
MFLSRVETVPSPRVALPPNEVVSLLVSSAAAMVVEVRPP